MHETGAHLCQAGDTSETIENRPFPPTAGIGRWYLHRYCHDGGYRLWVTTNNPVPLEYLWMEIDSVPGGCNGIDRVVVGTYSGPGAGRDVVHTPSCDASTWRWTGAAIQGPFEYQMLNLDFAAAAIGDPASFEYRVFVRLPGQTAPNDVVPSDGPRRFAVG